MFGHPATQKFCAIFTLLSFGTSGLAPCWAASDFAADWQAKPLIDTSAPAVIAPVATPPAANQPASPSAEQAALEEKLKPAEPFISSVEKQLLITPKAGSPLTQRLNALQDVLYGEPKFQDAGELLGDMARLFPSQAAKAAADLQAKMQVEKPASTQPSTGKVASNRPTVSSPAAPAMANLPPSNASAKKKHFWQSEDDPFANDPFFQDQPNRNTGSYSSTPSSGQQVGPSKMASIGQGLAGLAMMAGAMAGSYYLNRGNNAVPPQNGYYNNYPYGYNPYGTPYGYGANAYGQIPAQVPYGYNPAYPYSYPNTYPNAYPGGMTLNAQPYRPYGTTTFPPFGTSTRIIPY